MKTIYNLYRASGAVRSLPGLLVVALLGMSVGVVNAEVYRWVDSNGQVHYSDRPNPVSSQVTVGETNSVGTYVVPEAEEEGESTEAATARTRAEQCEMVKKRLDSYRNAGTVVRRDELGEETEISAEQRVELIVKTEGQVKVLCGPQPDESAQAG